MSRPILPSLFRSGSNRPVFQHLHDEIDRVFDDFGDMFSEFGEKFDRKQKGMLMPKVDVSENEAEIEISAELPGLTEDDVDVTVVDKTLIIKGERTDEHEEKEKDYHLIECSRGSYMRTIPLGFNVDEDKIDATIKNGILKILVTKPEEVAEKVRKIPVKKSA